MSGKALHDGSVVGWVSYVSKSVIFFALFSVLAGILVLAGWMFDIPVLKSVLPWFVTMKANTAIGFIFSGLSLALLARTGHSVFELRMSQVFASVTAIIGLLNICQYLFGLDLGIDQLFFQEPANAVGTPYPGRMSLATATNFLLLGSALLLANYCHSIRPAQALVLTTGLIGLLPLIGYLYGATAFIAIGQYTQMAVHTTVVFIVMSIGVLALHPADGIMRIITSDTVGGWMLRHLLPFIIGVPIILGWFRVEGELHGYFESSLGGAIAMTCTIMLLIALLWWFAKALNRIDLARQQADLNLLEGAESYIRLFESAIDGIFLLDFDTGMITNTNQFMKDRLGYSKEELLGKHIWDVGFLKDVALSEEAFLRLQSCGYIRYEDLPLRTKDGKTMDVEFISKVYLAGSKKFIQCNVRDISHRKKAEELLRNREKLFRSTLDNMLEGCQILGFDWRYLYLNDVAVNHSRRPKEELLGNVYMEFWPGVENTEVFARMKQCMEERTRHSMESEFIFPDGNKGWFDLRIQPVPEGVFILSIDVTERKLAEAALRVSEQEFHSLAEAMPQIVWVTRADCWNTYFNQQWVDYTGLTLEESYGHGWNIPFHPDDRQRAWDSWQRSTKNDAPYALECRLRRADGVYRWWLIRGTPLRDVNGKILKWFGTCTDIEDIKQFEEKLRESRANLEVALTSMTDAVFISNAAGEGVEFNDAFASFHRFRNKEECAKKLSDFPDIIEVSMPNGELVPLGMWAVQRALRGETVTNAEYKIHRKDTDETWTGSYSFGPIRNNDAVISGAVVVARDITELKQAEDEKSKLEEQLNQAQKMEAIGKLAGGVAHDFNNMLSVINGYSDILLTELPPTDKKYLRVQEINKAGKRSAELTRQLLAFARKQVISPKVIDLNDEVAGMLKMLQRLIGENIGLVWKPSPNLWKVKADPSQLNQILANLIVNCRDAISGVGNVAIETGNADIDDDFCKTLQGVVSGKHVVLKVSDNGCGMDKSIVEHIFEPFFTTKKIGEGTGLGLATVFGIVKQNNGFIDVYSEPGKGTTFKIYLPRYESEDGEITEEPEKPKKPTGTETVLIVEDEEALLQLAKVQLEELGYTVLAAGSPVQAIKLSAEYKGDIHLLMTDVVMPGMSGRDLKEMLVHTRPGIKCLYMSGYTADIIANNGVLDKGIHFLEKPFTSETLSAKLREALCQPKK